ncbi:unnamed protein product [Caenorhabditis auriculariae]|uniref:Uncharacterized protein n=1 Tax=Caenorhabditis auriculariae TaxID=2777116 RepID=A0A8S1HPI3_9PELO|nr:unnamed protein product [Caenorhabditis auriculariae]
MGLLLKIVAVSFAALTAANICTDNTVKLNKQYFCFEGCLNTATAVQNYKVQLSTGNQFVERIRRREEIIAKFALPDDPNAQSCIDPVLRQDVGSAINKTTRHDCKGIINTLALNLNRPGWAYICVKFNSFGVDSIVADKNFCDYDAFLQGEIFNVRLAKIDMS